MPIGYRMDVAGLKGLFGLPIPSSPVNISQVSKAMLEVSAAGEKGFKKPLAKDTFSASKDLAETEKAINEAFGGVDI